MNRKILTIAIIALAIDQITKVATSIILDFNRPIQVIKDFFYLTLCHNDGAAWGLFSNTKIIIIIGTFIALLVIYHFIYCFKRNNRNNIAFGLLLGGLSGNLIDRLLFGHVRDFLDFYIFGYDYPVFNIADICIVVGVILLIIAIIKGEDTNEDNSNRKSSKTRQIPSE